MTIDRRRHRRIKAYARALAIVVGEMTPPQLEEAANRLELEAGMAHRRRDREDWADLAQVAEGLRAVLRSRRKRNHLSGMRS